MLLGATFFGGPRISKSLAVKGSSPSARQPVDWRIGWGIAWAGLGTLGILGNLLVPGRCTPWNSMADCVPLVPAFFAAPVGPLAMGLLMVIVGKAESLQIRHRIQTGGRQVSSAVSVRMGRGEARELSRMANRQSARSVAAISVLVVATLMLLRIPLSLAAAAFGIQKTPGASEIVLGAVDVFWMLLVWLPLGRPILLDGSRRRLRGEGEVDLGHVEPMPGGFRFESALPLAPRFIEMRWSAIRVVGTVGGFVAVRGRHPLSPMVMLPAGIVPPASPDAGS